MKSPPTGQAWSAVFCVALFALPSLAQQFAPDPATPTPAQPSPIQPAQPAPLTPTPTVAEPAPALDVVPLPAPTAAAAPALEPARQEMLVRVFAMRNARASEVALTISRCVFVNREHPFNIAADQRTNSLIALGSEDQLRRVGDLVTQLDAPTPAESTARQVRIFPLKYARGEILVKTLQHVSPDSMVAADPTTNSLLVSGNTATTQLAELLIRELDVRRSTAPQQSRKVRVVWLVSDMDLPDPPPDMKDVTDELESLGIKNLRLVTQNMIQTTAGEEFSIQSTPPGFLNCRVKIQGQFEESDTGAPRLKLSLNAVGKLPSRELPTPSAPSNAPPAPQPSGSNELASLATTVIAPPGHKVVLGVTPIDKYTSVFVIQILANEAGK